MLFAPLRYFEDLSDEFIFSLASNGCQVSTEISTGFSRLPPEVFNPNRLKE